jgi:phosphopantothenoylcysteine decarboxylase
MTDAEDGGGAAAAEGAAAPPRRPRVLLGLTGSVAAVKAPELAAALGAFADVRVVATDAARRFFDAAALPLRNPTESDASDGAAASGALPAAAAAVAFHGDEDDWRAWRAVGDEVLHIELRRWADCLVLAPLSANSLAKVAAGLCDNLLTCVVRAWDFGGGSSASGGLRRAGKPVVAVPAMNTLMWESPFTARHLAALAELGVAVVPPVAKKLACGDVGVGAMAAPADVAAAARAALAATGAFPSLLLP